MLEVPHPEWESRTDGSARFAGDVKLKGSLFGVVLRSPHAHARILRLDVSRAQAAPGVAAVLTAAAFGDVRYEDYGAEDRFPLAREVVRHIGHEVAAVAATSMAEAEAACELIEVDYRPLPAAHTLKQAMARGAPRVHDDRNGPRNQAKGFLRRFESQNQEPLRAECRVQGRYRYGIQAHAAMEPHTVQARWNGDSGQLEVWAPTQAPRNIRREIARILQLEEAKIRLHRVAVGGDFGSRVRASELEVLTCALAMETGRPVKMQLSRQDEFAHTKHRHDFFIDMETRSTASGRLISRHASIDVESGAFCHAGANELNYASILIGSHYRLQTAEVRGAAWYTHRRPGGSFRGAGGPQAIFAIESQMDELAEQLNMDPIDLRLLNIHATGDHTATGWDIDASSAGRCLELVRTELDWDEKRKLGKSGRGVGVAMAVHVSGAIVNDVSNRAEVVVTLDADGGIVIASGAADPGTGQTATIAHIAASELGVNPEDVSVEMMDTDNTPYDPGAGSSRGTTITGGAVAEATRDAANYFREVAAGKFGVAPEYVTIRNGWAYANGDAVRIGDLVSISDLAEDGILRFHRETVAPVPVAVDENGRGNLSPSYSFSAHGVEVDVDQATGKVTVVRVVAVHDSGVILNKNGAQGQVTGGVVMGLGAALSEELLFEDGRVVNPAYVDYHLLRPDDAPEVDVHFVGAPAPKGPHGAKGLAEIAMMPTAAAVANAVAHATGVRVRELPLTPDRILPHLPTRTKATRARSILLRPNRWWDALVRWAYPRGLHYLLHRWGTRFARKPASAGIEQIEVPSDVSQVVASLTMDGTRPVGGATDAVVADRQRLPSASPVLVALRGAEELTRIVQDRSGAIRIGAAVTLAELDVALGDDMPGLRNALRGIASPQLRATATVGGNLCQEKRCWYYRHGFDCYKRGGTTCPCYAIRGDHRFFHAAMDTHRCQAVTPSDLAVIFGALDVDLNIESRKGSRRSSIEQFYVGPGETTLGKSEALIFVEIPEAARRRDSVFEKLNLSAGGFAVVSACLSLARDIDGTITEAHAFLGGVSAIPMRLPELEANLIGCRSPMDVSSRLYGSWARTAHPLPQNAWKLDAAAGLIRRCVENV